MIFLNHKLHVIKEIIEKNLILLFINKNNLKNYKKEIKIIKTKYLKNFDTSLLQQNISNEIKKFYKEHNHKYNMIMSNNNMRNFNFNHDRDNDKEKKLLNKLLFSYIIAKFMLK